MAYELLIIIGGIVFGLVGFFIGAILVHRAYKASPSLTHYRKIVDILTLRKLHKKLYSDDLVYDNTKKLKKGKDYIEHYEGMRDKLTTRKKKDSEPLMEGLGLGGIDLGSIIGGAVAIFIGVILIPTIAQQVGKVTEMQNVSISSSGTGVLSAVPVIFAIGVLGIAIAIVFSTFRSIGVVV